IPESAERNLSSARGQYWRGRVPLRSWRGLYNRSPWKAREQWPFRGLPAPDPVDFLLRGKAPRDHKPCRSHDLLSEALPTIAGSPRNDPLRTPRGPGARLAGKSPGKSNEWSRRIFPRFANLRLLLPFGLPERQIPAIGDEPAGSPMFPAPFGSGRCGNRREPERRQTQDVVRPDWALKQEGERPGHSF